MKFPEREIKKGTKGEPPPSRGPESSSTANKKAPPQSKAMENPTTFGMKKPPLKLPERNNRPRAEERNLNASDFSPATLETKRTTSSKFRGILEFST